MARYVNSSTAAEIISEYTNVPLYELVDIMTEVPSEDVASVRHGHWIRVKGIIQCDICGFGLFPDGYFFENGECTHSNEQDYRLNFCPNCGAKMDKES